MSYISQVIEDLTNIQADFSNHVRKEKHTSDYFEMKIYQQFWVDSVKTLYVFLPKKLKKEDALVFVDGKFAYSVYSNALFLCDIARKAINSDRRYYINGGKEYYDEDL